MRRVLLLALGALLLAAGPSGAAGLGAGVVVGGEAHFTLYGRDRASYLVDVVAEASEAGTRGSAGSVSVTVRRCLGFGCGPRLTYVGALPAGSFSVATDLSSASLSTRLFGKPFDVTWSSPQSSTLASYDADPAGPRVGARLYEVTHVSGVLLGRPCGSKDGLVSREVLVDSAATVTSSLPKALPRSLTGLAHAAC